MCKVIQDQRDEIALLLPQRKYLISYEHAKIQKSESMYNSTKWDIPNDKQKYFYSVDIC